MPASTTRFWNIFFPNIPAITWIVSVEGRQRHETVWEASSGDNVKGHHGGRGSWSFSLLGVKGLRTMWKSLDKQQEAAAVFKQGSDVVTFVFKKKKKF